MIKGFITFKNIKEIKKKKIIQQRMEKKNNTIYMMITLILEHMIIN